MSGRTYRPATAKRQRFYLPNATLPAHQADCPVCGLRVALPTLYQGQEASCPRCHHPLARIESRPYMMTLACALASLIVLLLVYSLPFVTIAMPGVYSPLRLPEMLFTLLGGDWGFLGGVLFVFTFGVPLLFVLLCLYLYFSLWQGKTPPGMLWAARLITRLRHALMVDVFFISVMVAYIKIVTVAQVDFGAAFWLLPVLALLLLRTSLAVSEHWVYRQIRRTRRLRAFQAAENTVCCTRCLHFRPLSEGFCGVCGTELGYRRPGSLSLSAAFLLAAAILYLPANLLPIMISSNPLKTEISTIMSGIIFMWNDGDKLIAVIIFSASIAVPTLKILSMLVLLYCARFKPLMPVWAMSLQYRITEAVGRWSMIDVFVIIMMMSAFHTPIAHVSPGPASVYFCLVVILTMCSAYFFDPRLLWDHAAAERPSSEP